MADWHNMKTINALRDQFDESVAEVMADEDLTQAAKARRVRELAEDFRGRYDAEKRELEEAMEGHKRSLTRKAYPAEKIGEDVQRELLEEIRGQRIERDIATRAEAGGFNPIEALEDARYRGDTARQAIIERIGKRYLPDDESHRREFERLLEESRRERMTPGQRAGLEELEAFERLAGELGQALALTDRTVKARLDALSKMPVPEERPGVANRSAGIGKGGEM